MKIAARLTNNGQPVDRYEFEILVEGDFQKGAHAAYAQFRKNHPDIAMFADGVQVTFGKG